MYILDIDIISNLLTKILLHQMQKRNILLIAASFFKLFSNNSEGWENVMGNQRKFGCMNTFLELYK